MKRIALDELNKGRAIRWTEAEPKRDWPQRGGAPWPTDAEYAVLRAAKQAIDTGNYVEAPACPCPFCMSSKEAGWVCFVIIKEPTPEGAQKVAGVKRATNEYGYESGIYLNCEGVRSKDFLMRWDGVPLKSIIYEDHREPEWNGGSPFEQRIGVHPSRNTVRSAIEVAAAFRRKA